MEFGFRLIEEKFIKEIDSVGRLYLHEKSGARLFHIENKDDNKVFTISFKTPPVDNTGLTHILEHSVLCGSRKFPVKEPFVELAKGSLNTFLNALTFPDKTMYPVASKNSKDFINLMDVYLDAVFYPNIYKSPEIFMQEGWHYEINSRSEEITYKGVVYNEMLGAFSSPEEILFSKIMESLYPDTSYRYESGGNPEDIPQLTYDKFLAYHKKYYHPSNSYIYLYGNGDLSDQLRFLDEKYLKDFTKTTAMPPLEFQETFLKTQEQIVYYSVSSKEEELEGTYFSMNFAVGNACDPVLTIALSILEYILLETSGSPLRKALIEANIGRDVIGHYDEGLIKPMLNIVLKDSKEKNKDKFIQIVRDTLKELVKNGLNKRMIEAAINSMEFKFRESDGGETPKGILFGIKCMDSWLYNEDPFVHLQYENALKTIKELAAGNYFEKLIEEYLIENTHSTIVTLIPKWGLAEEKAEEMRESLRGFKEKLDEKELSKLINENKKLKELQTAGDTEEDLMKIPVIDLEDINPTSETMPLEVREESGTKVLFHNVYTNEIIYLDLLFDTSSVPEEKLPYIALLADVIGGINTEKFTYGELSNEIDIHTGGIDFNVEVYEEINEKKYYPKFVVESKVLGSKLPELILLLSEIVNESKFNDKKRLREIIREVKSELEMELIEDGHLVAAKRLCSYFSDYACYVEKLTGISYYNFISELDVNFNNTYKDIVKSLRLVKNIIFNKSNLIASLTCQNKGYEQFQETYPLFVDKLGDKAHKSVDNNSQYFLKNEGFYTSGNVQYVAKGYNFKDLGYSYSGHLQVLKNILSLDYLWNRIRVKGGAYGAFMRIEMSGNAYFVSYRDPNLNNTLMVYDEIWSYIDSFEVSEREMKKYIIGTISNLDQPLTPPQMAQRADEMYFRGITNEDIQRERDEVLTTDTMRIRGFSKLVKAMMKENYLCVIGSEVEIKNNLDRFDSTNPLLWFEIEE